MSIKSLTLTEMSRKSAFRSSARCTLWLIEKSVHQWKCNVRLTLSNSQSSMPAWIKSRSKSFEMSAIKIRSDNIISLLSIALKWIRSEDTKAESCCTIANTVRFVLLLGLPQDVQWSFVLNLTWDWLMVAQQLLASRSIQTTLEMNYWWVFRNINFFQFSQDGMIHRILERGWLCGYACIFINKNKLKIFATKIRNNNFSKRSQMILFADDILLSFRCVRMIADKSWTSFYFYLREIGRVMEGK